MDPLNVREGKEIIVSTKAPGNLENSLYRVKPKNVVALKALSGIEKYDKFLNINDGSLFEKIDSNNSGSLVEISGERSDSIEGYNSSLIGAIINQLGDNRDVPSRIRLNQASRSGGFSGAIRTRDIMIPEFVRDLEVFVPVFAFDDTVVEKNATLVIDQDTTHFTTKNLYMYEGSRILQRSRKLTMRVLGEMEGRT